MMLEHKIMVSSWIFSLWYTVVQTSSTHSTCYWTWLPEVQFAILIVFEGPVQSQLVPPSGANQDWDC